jgi:hypothetical protein
MLHGFYNISGADAAHYGWMIDPRHPVGTPNFLLPTANICQHVRRVRGAAGDRAQHKVQRLQDSSLLLQGVSGSALEAAQAGVQGSAGSLTSFHEVQEDFLWLLGIGGAVAAISRSTTCSTNDPKLLLL